MTDLPASVRWQLWIVAFGFFMQSLDTTIVNTALPSMAKSLGESPLHMHMIIVSYVLTVAVMLPASGWLADRVGVRNIFFTAIVLFTAGSLFCAQASTLDQLAHSAVRTYRIISSVSPSFYESYTPGHLLDLRSHLVPWAEHLLLLR